MTETTDPPAEIVELAESFRQFALRSIGVELDYSSETLSVFDAYLGSAREPLSGQQAAEPLVARAATAYFGEVVRRRVDGFWRQAAGDMLKWEVCSRRAFCGVRPAVVVLEAIRQAPVGEGALRLAPEDAASVEHRLNALPEVSEDEYYLPSARYDVIEIVFTALRDAMLADGTSDVTFQAEDYDD